MAAKVHKTLRLEPELVSRCEALRKDGEPISTAMARIIGVGCITLECATNGSTGEHDVAQPEHDVAQVEHSEDAQRLIDALEAENARLRAEHEADRAAIAEKDAKIAAALDKAHELAEQAHILVAQANAPEALPPAEDAPEAPRKISFRDWWRNHR